LASGGGPRMTPSPGTTRLVVPGDKGYGWAACREPGRCTANGKRRHREGRGTMCNDRHGRAMSGNADDNRRRQRAAMTTAGSPGMSASSQRSGTMGRLRAKGCGMAETGPWLRMMSLSQTTVCGSTRKLSDDASCTFVATRMPLAMHDRANAVAPFTACGTGFLYAAHRDESACRFSRLPALAPPHR
jgi:hypothetical protein